MIRAGAAMAGRRLFLNVIFVRVDVREDAPSEPAFCQGRVSYCIRAEGGAVDGRFNSHPSMLVPNSLWAVMSPSLPHKASELWSPSMLSKSTRGSRWRRPRTTSSLSLRPGRMLGRRRECCRRTNIAQCHCFRVRASRRVPRTVQRRKYRGLATPVLAISISRPLP